MKTHALSLIVAVSALALLTSCKKTAEKDKSKTSSATESEAEKERRDLLRFLGCEFYACGDGTFYLIQKALPKSYAEDIPGFRTDSRVSWLVNGKAVEIPCQDVFEIGADFHSDARGGLYARGVKHLWYFKDGKGAIVRTVSRDSISAKEHLPSRSTVVWSVLSAYGQAAYEAGYDEGDANAGQIP